MTAYEMRISDWSSDVCSSDHKTEIAKDEEPMKVGDSKAGLAGAAKKLSATYDFAIHTHGSIGPSCAVADMRDGKATVWTASQAPHVLHQQIGRASCRGRGCRSV